MVCGAPVLYHFVAGNVMRRACIDGIDDNPIQRKHIHPRNIKPGETVGGVYYTGQFQTEAKIEP